MRATRHPTGVLAMMGCLGVYSALTQVTLLREMLVVFYGNELTVGSILGCWLLCIGFGALVARFTVPRLPSARSVRIVVTALLLVLASVLLKQVSWVRSIRTALSIDAGEYAPLRTIIAIACGACAPSGLLIGFCFPCACRLMVDAGARGIGAVSRVYTVEALGSMAGGALLTFLLLPRLTPLQVVILAQAVAGSGAVAVAPYRPLKVVLAALVVLAAAFVLHDGPALKGVEAELVAKRWRGFGVLPASATTNASSPRLVTWTDSIYQNLAVIERAGQYELYANGEIMWSFPDPLEDEHRVHFIMAQNPSARRVLVLGGNPLGDIPELLKYPLRRLVYVELDAGIGRVLRCTAPAEYDALFRDRRVESETEDGVRYVRVSRDTFDAILINAPTPSTAAANRYYTLEFFRCLRERLAPHGFATFSVQSSVRLMDTSADYLASVYRTAKAVFPSVRVTAGAENRVFLGGADADITFECQQLAERSRASGVRTQYYRPEFFFATDVLDPEKVDFTLNRLESRPVVLNTLSRPVSYFHSLRLWLRYSGSEARKFADARSVGWPHVAAVLLLCGCLLLGAGRAMRQWGSCRRRAAWSRAMLTAVIATTGFCGMAYEILLVFVFQGLYGYVYTRMGIIVAAFMAGLVLGARCGRSLGETQWLGRRSLVGVEIALIAFPLWVLGLMGAAANVSGGVLEGVLEIAIHISLAGAGWMVGVEFPLANRLFCDSCGHPSVSAALTDASDHLGAALGAVLTGVLLVPVAGIAPTCFILIGIKTMSLLMLASGLAVAPSRPATDLA